MKLFTPLLTAGILIASVPAGATSIDFEEFGLQPSLFVDQEPLDDEFASEGVTFSGGWEILNEGGNFGVPALSGAHFAAFNTGAGTTDTLTAIFDDVISSISAFVGFGASSSWTVSGFLNGNLVSEVVFNQDGGQYAEIGLRGLFDEVSISSDQNAGVLDDLSFQTAQTPAPVPLPAGMVLMGTALLGLGFGHRKLTSKA